MAEFDIQRELQEMRREQRADHLDISNKVDGGFEAVSKTLKEHEQSDIRLFAALDQRVERVEATRRLLIWMAGALVVAVLGGAVDAYFNHHYAKEEIRATELPHPAEAGVPRR